MIRKFCIFICWLGIAICVLSILIVIIRGGIYLFGIKDFHVYIRGIRRPVGLLAIFSTIILFLKRIKFRLDDRRAKKIVLAILGVFALLFIWMKIVQHIVFWTGAYDLSMFDYAIFNTLKGNFMYTPMLGRSFFSEHFSPILLFFVPIYSLYASPVILLIAQALVTALSGYFLYKLARLEINNNLIPILIMIGYLGNKALMEGFWFDFHIELFEPFLVIGAFYFFKVRKNLLYWIFIILAIMCKEDVAIYVFVLGLYLWVFEKNVRLGTSTCIISLLWMILAWKIVIPLSYPETRHISHFLSRWSDFGNTYAGIAANLIKRPGFLLSRLLSKPSIGLFSPLLFLPLFSPSKLMLVIPPLLLNLTSNLQMQANLSLHYSVPIMPFLWIAGVYGLKRVRYTGISIIIALSLCIINFGHYRFYNIDSHVIIGYKIIKMIPDNTPVSVQSCFAPHISYRKDIWIFPRVENAEYIMVDERLPYWPLSSKKAFYRELKEYLSSSQWEILAEEDGYRLLKKVTPYHQIERLNH